MKKILSGVTAAAILLGSFLPCLAADYNGHWAEEKIKLLVSDGIISGDENGNINPGAYIKRSELVKTVNNAFGFEEEAENGFADVQSDKWYYKEFLKARKAGYIKGDEKGFANPEKNLTRAEAAVIIARVSGAEAEGKASFADSVPAWAEKEIAVLAEKGIIKGYEDGTFRADAYIRRGEAFSIIADIRKEKEDTSVKPEESNENTTGDISGMASANASKPSSRPSGGGGGGGSSSGGSGIIQLNAPVIKYLENNYLSWTEIKHSSGYEVKISDGENEITAVCDDEEADISEYAGELTANSVESSVTLYVSVKALGKTGVKASKYCEPMEFEYKVYDSENSAELGMKVAFGLSAEGAERYFLEFPEGISVISLKKEGDAENIENPVSPLEITEFVSDENGIKEDVYIFTARKGEEVQVISESLMYGGGEGTDESPFVVATGRHFKNIMKNPSASYVQSGDINVETSFNGEEESFSGKYTAENGAKINLTATGGSYASLFGKLKNAEIKNVLICGTITSEGIYTGSLCGYAAGSIISGCESEAVINISGDAVSNGAYCGGIAGYTDAETTVTECVFNGAVTSEAGMIGGITAKSDGNITGCVNNGTVTAMNTVLTGTASHAGGILAVGGGNAEIRDCINNGTVENYYQSLQDSVTTFASYTGGIAGVAYKIYSCENSESGKVVALINSGAPANISGYQNVGGIVGRLETGAVAEGCINEGALEIPASSTVYWGGGIAGYTKGTIRKCANYSSSFTGRQFGGITGRCLGVVSRSFNKGNITAAGYAGGFAARTDAGAVIEYCYNTGNISGRYAAGFSGSAGSPAVIIRNSYSAPVTECSNAIIAYNQKVDITDVYYVKKGVETPGANTGAKEVSAEVLNSQETVDILNGGAEAFVTGENGYPVLLENPEKEDV